MEAIKIRSALADITAEQDPTVKSLKMASLVGALWAERGVELVVVGGSAIEILTEGAYASGDLDMCHVNLATLPIRQRQEIMGQLGAEGGPRNWRVAGMYGTCWARWKALRIHRIAAYKRHTVKCW